MAAARQLTRRQAAFVGIATIACGALPILVAAGVLHPDEPLTAPRWVPVAAGLVFVCGGLAVLVDFALGGIGPDGDFVPGTPFGVRAASLALGLSIVGLMAAIFGWVAFGRGPRQFSTTVSIPFAVVGSRSSGFTGRLAFGLAAILMAIGFVACGVSGVRRLFRTHREAKDLTH